MDKSQLKRGSGILLHISSLPGDFGIGDFGPEASTFIDFLKDAGQSYWQVLPFNPTGSVYGNSPYCSLSAFALNELFISPDVLLQQSLLKEDDLSQCPVFQSGQVQYEDASAFKAQLLAKAFERFKGQRKKDDYQEFCQNNAFWLDDFALFSVLKNEFKGRPWNEWPLSIRQRDAGAMSECKNRYSEKIDRIKFIQYQVHAQWHKCKQYCNSCGIRIIGDAPIYVSYDSADVWSHPDIFDLDENFLPRKVAGVPPDYFSETGQRWGNPLYNWELLKKHGFDWWMQRLKYNLMSFDLIRIDHFRGFVGYWEVPAGEQTAKNGKWQKGPGDAFFNKVMEEFPGAAIIAEDLGIITDDVIATMERFHLPGMKVLQFAFNDDIRTHPYIPENYNSPCVAYTGTHDNNTLRGWFRHDISQREKDNLEAYLKKLPKEEGLVWELSAVLMRSAADIVIIPMQDYLGLGSEARMNKPGTVNGNWEWRLKQGEANPELSGKIRNITQAFR